jgi:hypothetical protein
MNKRANRIPPALRHGVYSGMALLPGEDPVAFQKFRDEILAEYQPVGRSVPKHGKTPAASWPRLCQVDRVEKAGNSAANSAHDSRRSYPRPDRYLD